MRKNFDSVLKLLHFFHYSSTVKYLVLSCEVKESL